MGLIFNFHGLTVVANALKKHRLNCVGNRLMTKNEVLKKKKRDISKATSFTEMIRFLVAVANSKREKYKKKKRTATTTAKGQKENFSLRFLRLCLSVSSNQ